MLRNTGATATRWHWTVVGIIVLIALAVRLYYVNTAIVDHPLRGDTRQYFAYALNLIDHHVFSMEMPGQATPLPDAFRDPGYSTFLALLITGFGRGQDFYLAALNIQAVLSAATVLIYMILAQRWLGRGAAAVVGIGMALWPHMITLSGLVLSETLMGFLVACALVCLEYASQRRSIAGAALTGGLFALAALTNATIIPAILVFASFAAWRDTYGRRFWVTLFVAAMLPLGAWALRGISIPPERAAGDRVAMNLVQGSWPEFHQAWYDAMNGNNEAAAVMSRINGEYTVLRTNREQGLHLIGARLLASPARYITWYVSKPAELWGWSIGIGEGDIYVFPTFNSPLSGSGMLRFSTDLLFLLSPLLLMLATVGLITIFVAASRYPLPLLAAGIVAAVTTLVFSALQADARYSTPYRGIEWILLCVGTHELWRIAGRIRRIKQAS